MPPTNCRTCAVREVNEMLLTLAASGRMRPRDWAILDARINQRLSLRAVGRSVGITHQGCHRRLRVMASIINALRTSHTTPPA